MNSTGKVSFNSRLPAKLTVMRRLVFITETAGGTEATNTIGNEPKEFWIYAGYKDILKDDSGIDWSVKVSLSLFYFWGDFYNLLNV